MEGEDRGELIKVVANRGNSVSYWIWTILDGCGFWPVTGVPKYVRSDNGPEFTARQIRTWLNELGTGTLFIEPGSPWENGYIESFNGKMRDELLNGEIFDTLLEAQVLIERWRIDLRQSGSTA